jgi:mannose-6-phosphate isomerase
MKWYPIKLTAHVRAYNFGERLIPEMLGKVDVPGGIVAETWEISDYRDTTGTVTNGELAGRTLHDITMSYPEELVGAEWSGPHFPLLAKFLDASHMLPVHLHADDATAARVYNAPNGKSEAWHILWADEGASILAGLTDDPGKEELFDAFKAQDYDRVMPRFPIQAGDTIYVPGGIIHSFGPGTLIYEIQQTSDLGNDVMPADLYGTVATEAEWDAKIERTLSELKNDYWPKPNPGLAITVDAGRFRVGGVCEHFAIERWALDGAVSYDLEGRRCGMLSNVGDPVRIGYGDGEAVELGRAESCILPAALGPARIVPTGESGDLIYSYVPDRQIDIIEPLRQAGYTNEEIATLGHVFSES